MSVPLETLTSSFQGLIPAVLATCSRDGIPNVTLLSHVEYVDSRHVALSFQFFNKSRRNISENPRALVKIVDPDTRQGWALDLRYVRSETAGPVFERMALRIEAVASYSGLKGIFKLRAADIYEVQCIEPIAEEPASFNPALPTPHASADPVFTMRALQDLSARIHRAASLESLLDSILAGLEEYFGFTHSMILLTGEEEGVLVTMSTHGYPEGGVGAEARHGEGIAGMVAEARKPIRISGLMRAMLYALAVQRYAQERGFHPERRIPMPGLPTPDSQLGVPLLMRGELIGVLCIESDTPYRFHEEDKQTIELLGSYLAIAIQNMQLLERNEMHEPAPEPLPTTPSHAKRSTAPVAGRHEVTLYGGEECILVDGEYLIRSLPARILWKLLSARCREGRDEFTNRELRLDKSLNLPEYKDNLETRLLLLRRRLEQKCPDIRIVPRGRGRFALQLDCDVDLRERA